MHEQHRTKLRLTDVPSRPLGVAAACTRYEFLFQTNTINDETDRNNVTKKIILTVTKNFGRVDTTVFDPPPESKVLLLLRKF